jgi:uncharacterized protein YgiM (DUF1202 family)
MIVAGRQQRSRQGLAGIAATLTVAAVVLLGEANPAFAKQSGDEFLIVDCLLPGQVRKLGSRLTFLAPRRAIRTSQTNCEIRGGEYASYDRSSYATALKIWLPQAEKGDPKAQTYIGEMAEKGLGQVADYGIAAVWYRRAAEQGYSPAQINLGQLYEKGLGVAKDPKTAFMWYRRASGLDGDSFENVRFGDAREEVKELQTALDKKTDEVDALTREVSTLNLQLTDATTKRRQVHGRITEESAKLERERAELEKKRQSLNTERVRLLSVRASAGTSPFNAPFVALKNANIRLGPSTSTRIVDGVKRGETVNVVGKLDDIDWYIVIAPNGEPGYIFGRLIEQRSAATPPRQAQRPQADTAEIAALEKEKAQLSARSAEIAERAKALELERQAFGKERQESEDSIAKRQEGLERSLAEAKTELERKRQEIAERESATAALKTELEGRRRALTEEISAERKRIRRELADERTAFEQESKQLAEMRASLKAYQKDLNTEKHRVESEASKQLSQKEQKLAVEKDQLLHQARELTEKEAALVEKQRDLEAERAAADEAVQRFLAAKNGELTVEADLLSKQSSVLRERETELRRQEEDLNRRRSVAEQSVQVELEKQSLTLVRQREDLMKKASELTKREALLAERQHELEEKRRLASAKTQAVRLESEKIVAKDKEKLRQQAAELSDREAAVQLKREALMAQQKAAKQEMQGEFAAHNQKLDERRAALGKRTYELAVREAAMDRKRKEMETENLKAQQTLALELELRVEGLVDKKAELRREAEQISLQEAALEEKRAAWEREEQESRRRMTAEWDEHSRRMAHERSRLDPKIAELANRETTLELKEQQTKAKKRAADREIAAELKKLGDGIARRNRELEKLEARYEKRRNDLKYLGGELTQMDAMIEQRRYQIVSLEQRSGGSGSAAANDAPVIKIIEPALHQFRGNAVVVTNSDSEYRTIVGKITALNGLYELFVNGTNIPVDAGSMFQTKVKMTGAKTPVQVVALDKAGQRQEVSFVLQRNSDVPSQADPQSNDATGIAPDAVNNLKFGKFYALIIGNRMYRSMPVLRTPENDATELAALLQRKYGFKTKLLLNATRYQILSELNEIRAQLTETDNFLLYFAGHGILDETNNRGHWLPVDAEADSSANWISNVSVTDIVNTMSARKVLVIADSCYSGTLTRSVLARLDAGKSKEARISWLSLMVEKRSRMAMTSGGVAPVLDGGGGRNSIFAKALIDVLRENKSVIDGRTLHQKVAQSVTYAAKEASVEQVPQYTPIKFSGHEAGDYFFVPIK